MKISVGGHRMLQSDGLISPNKKRILCVDDDRESCEMIATLLGLSGYEVIAALSCEDAIESVRSGGFDLILLDNRLPDGSGIDLCRQIHLIRPDIPILFYSGASHEADKQAAMAAGAQAYLIKPTGIDTLEQTISRLLGDGHRVTRLDPRTASSSRVPRIDGVLTLESIKVVRYWCAERARVRVERSRQLAEETRQRINSSVLKTVRLQSERKGHE